MTVKVCGFAASTGDCSRYCRDRWGTTVVGSTRRHYHTGHCWQHGLQPNANPVIGTVNAGFTASSLHMHRLHIRIGTAICGGDCKGLCFAASTGDCSRYCRDCWVPQLSG
ncbi:MAG: hypothetical protein IPN89_17475 [Saprospiraceae bacterium]|nr:hypothetical protein [Saprospiraceae bacterium]